MNDSLPGYTALRGVSISPGLEIPRFETPETGSTMDDAAALVRSGFSGWGALTALTQRAGRGTRGREWTSPPGRGLWMSVILPPPRSAHRLDGLPLLAAGTMAETLFVLTGVRFEIKLPNDVVREGRKIAGILAETVIHGDEVLSVVLGIGLDIAVQRAEFDAAGLTDATSLILETGCAPEREDVIREFLRRFAPAYQTLVRESDAFSCECIPGDSDS